MPKVLSDSKACPMHNYGVHYPLYTYTYTYLSVNRPYSLAFSIWNLQFLKEEIKFKMNCKLNVKIHIFYVRFTAKEMIACVSIDLSVLVNREKEKERERVSRKIECNRESSSSHLILFVSVVFGLQKIAKLSLLK